MLIRYTFLFTLCFQAFTTFSQKEFDKYGPFGCQVYTDLKEALRIEKKVYKVDLSYQKLDPKVYDKLASLSDLQALKLSGNEVSVYPKNFESLYNLLYFASYNNKFTSLSLNSIHASLSLKYVYLSTFQNSVRKVHPLPYTTL